MKGLGVESHLCVQELSPKLQVMPEVFWGKEHPTPSATPAHLENPHPLSQRNPRPHIHGLPIRSIKFDPTHHTFELRGQLKQRESGVREGTNLDQTQAQPSRSF